MSVLESLDQEINLNDDLPPPSYYNNQSTVESDTSNCCSNCNAPKILGIIFLILAAFFALYGSIMYGISVSKYNKFKKDHPDYQIFKVSTGLSIIHWLFFAVAIIGMCACFFLSSNHNYIILAVPLGLFGIFWIAYGVAVGTSDIYKASAKLQNEQYFIDYSDSLKNAKPYIEFKASADKYRTDRSKKGTCRLSAIRLYASSWTDSTTSFNLTNQTEISLIRTAVELNIGNPHFVDDIKSEILSNLKTRCHHITGDICENWKITTSYGIEGQKNLVFVSLTGEVPSKFNKNTRILKGTFWAGTPYVFDLAASSSYSTYQVQKNDVIITGSIDSDTIRRKCKK